VRDEDGARLSLLGHEHINMLGRYPSRSRNLSPRRVNCGRSETPTRQAMRAESEFLFRCYSDPYINLTLLRNNLVGAVISTLTFPVRRPFLTVALAAATLAASVHFFGPVATFGAISKGAKGVSMAFSDAAKVVTGIRNAATCPGVVDEVGRHGVTKETAPDVARCTEYFPSGVKSPTPTP
jgi:hypothetical protein